MAECIPEASHLGARGPAFRTLVPLSQRPQSAAGHVDEEVDSIWPKQFSRDEGQLGAGNSRCSVRVGDSTVSTTPFPKQTHTYWQSSGP